MIIKMKNYRACTIQMHKRKNPYPFFAGGAERKNEKKKKEVLTKRLLSAMMGTVSES